MVLTPAALTGGGVVAAEQTMTPMERVASRPKGQLKNPYADFASVAEEGHRKYMAAGCNGCHGGGGGGGMAAPLTNQVWIYGDDDDTLFRLITPTRRNSLRISSSSAPVVFELRMRSTISWSLYIYPYFHELTSLPIILPSAWGR
jgi:hypothetical protein